MSLRSELVRLALPWLVRRHRDRVATVAEARQRFAFFAGLAPAPPPDTERIWLDAGGARAIRVSTPVSAPDRLVLYLHGGAYVAGSPALYRDFIWRVATASRSRVVVPDYRLAPEHPFPAALDDAVNAYRWLLHGGASPQRIALMGDSAGGGLVLGALLRLRDEGAPLPGAAVALSPWTDLALTGESLRRNAGLDAIVDPAEMPRFAGYYLGGADPHTPYASPLYGDPTGLPPTLIQVSDEETLLDDSVRLAERMRAAGCDVSLEVWPRMPHVWQTWARVVPEARRALVRIGAFVQEKCA
jgi:acetyl esterase/lipase